MTISAQIKPDNNFMLEWALAYADAGWKIVPVHRPLFDENKEVRGCSCQDRQSCGKIGKHPMILAWQLNTSKDPRQIQYWWRQWPRANIGLVTGTVNMIGAVDLDTPQAKEVFIQKLLDRGMKEGNWPVIRSGSGHGEAHLFE
jgi:hypothetical protein